MTSLMTGASLAMSRKRWRSCSLARSGLAAADGVGHVEAGPCRLERGRRRQHGIDRPAERIAQRLERQRVERVDDGHADTVSIIRQRENPVAQQEVAVHAFRQAETVEMIGVAEKIEPGQSGEDHPELHLWHEPQPHQNEVEPLARLAGGEARAVGTDGIEDPRLDQLAGKTVGKAGRQGIGESGARHRALTGGCG